MTDLPPFGELADDTDELDWDRDRHGRMLDCQTADGAVQTIPYDDEHGVAAFTLRAPRGIGLGLPGALRAMGLTVELVPGWESRSAGSFNPGGAVSHWTAGSAAGDRGSLNVCINGRAGLPGPLCNVFLARSGVAVVVAAGRANHAGTGGWRGLSGNSAVWGTEAENSGYDAWTGPQRWAYPRVNAAYARLSGFGPEMCCGHSEWTPRKIDINNYTMDRMRAEVSALLTTGGDDMPTSEEVAAAVWDRIVQHQPAGAWLMGTRAAVDAMALESPGSPSFALVRKAGGEDGAVWLSNLVHRRWVRDGFDYDSVTWWLRKWGYKEPIVYDVEDLNRFGVPIGELPPSGTSGSTKAGK